MPSKLYRPALAIAVAFVSLLVCLVVIQPFVAAPVGFDAQATVLYFDRIASGTRLEQLLTTTPKPLLTIIYGLLHAATGDWRSLVWATIGVLAAASGLAAVVAARVAGNPTGFLVGLAVAATPLLVADAAYANAVPWALLGWVIAAILLGADRPRPGAAGVVLALAALCRLETLVLVGVGAVAFAWARFGPWPAILGQRPTPPPRAWLAILIPFVALPIMLIHDFLLTGNPLYWVDVSRRYSDAVRERTTIATPGERTIWFVRRFLPLWPMALAAAAGILVLVRRRAWLILVGLAGMGPGIAAFIVLLAARGTYAPERYALPVDIAVAILAAFAAGRLVETIAGWAGRRWAGSATPMRAALAFLLPIVALVVMNATRAGPFDGPLMRTIADVRSTNEHLDRVLGLLRSRSGDGEGPPRWLVPSSVLPRTAVDLRVPLSRVGVVSDRVLDADVPWLAEGQLVFFDRVAPASAALRGLASRGRVPVGRFDFVPVLSNHEAGYWVYEVVAR